MKNIVIAAIMASAAAAAFSTPVLAQNPFGDLKNSTKNITKEIDNKEAAPATSLQEDTMQDAPVVQNVQAVQPFQFDPDMSQFTAPRKQVDLGPRVSAELFDPEWQAKKEAIRNEGLRSQTPILESMHEATASWWAAGLWRKFKEPDFPKQAGHDPSAWLENMPLAKMGQTELTKDQLGYMGVTVNDAQAQYRINTLLALHESEQIAKRNPEFAMAVKVVDPFFLALMGCFLAIWLWLIKQHA